MVFYIKLIITHVFSFINSHQLIMLIHFEELYIILLIITFLIKQFSLDHGVIVMCIYHE